MSGFFKNLFSKKENSGKVNGLILNLPVEGEIKAVAFSIDGKRIAAGFDKNVVVWDIQRKKKVFSIEAYASKIEFSRDGKYIMGASTGITIFDAETGVEVRQFYGKNEVMDLFGMKMPTPEHDIIGTASYSSDSRLIISGSILKSVVKIWDASTGAEMKVFPGVNKGQKNNSPNAVIFSPKKDVFFVATSRDHKIQSYDMNGNEIRCFEGHTDHINDLLCNRDGSIIVSASNDKTIKIWDTKSGSELRTLSGHTMHVYSIAFTPDEKQIISGSFDNTVKVWNMENGEEIKTYYGHKKEVISVAVSSDGARIVSGSLDKTVKIWDLSADIHMAPAKITEYTQPNMEIRLDYYGRDLNEEIISVAYSPDGKSILTGARNFTSKKPFVRLWSAETGDLIKTYNGEGYVDFSPDGTMFSFISENKIKIMDMKSGKEITSLPAPDSSIKKMIRFSPDNVCIAAGSYGLFAKIWHIETGRELFQFAHNKTVNVLAFSPDGKLLLVGNGSELTLWDIKKGVRARSYSGHTRDINTIAFSPDGKYILSGSDDCTVKLWENKSARQIHSINHGIDNLQFVSFMKDGKHFISGSSLTGTKIKVLSILTGKEIKTICNKDFDSFSLKSGTLSYDGSKLAMGFNNSTMILYDLDNDEEIAHFIYASDDNWACALSSTGFYTGTENCHKDISPSHLPLLFVTEGHNAYMGEPLREKFYNPQAVKARLSK